MCKNKSDVLKDVNLENTVCSSFLLGQGLICQCWRKKILVITKDSERADEILAEQVLTISIQEFTQAG